MADDPLRSLSPQFLDRLRLTTEDAATLMALGEYRGKQELFRKQTPELLDSLKRVAIKTISLILLVPTTTPSHPPRSACSGRSRAQVRQR